MDFSYIRIDSEQADRAGDVCEIAWKPQGRRIATMSTELLVADPPQVETTARTAARTPLHPLWLGTGSGLLLWVTFPPAEWHWLAWVALVPFFLLVTEGRTRRGVYFGSWAGGLVFWILATEWVRLTDESAWPAWLLMGTVLSGFWPLTAALIRFGMKRLALPLPIVGSVVWIALEYVRAYFMTGFPWYYLAHTQYRQIELIQVADFSGAWGVSLLVVLVNTVVADLFRLPLLRPTAQGPRPTRAQTVRVASVVLAIGGALIYGLVRVRTAVFTPGPTVALLQSNMIQRMKTSRSAQEIANLYENLVERALAGPLKPDLIVWPETSFVYGVVKIDPTLPLEELTRQVQRFDPDGSAEDWKFKRDSVDAYLRTWVDGRINVPMLLGTILYDFRPGEPGRYNAAVLVDRNQVTYTSYHKLHLVPFGEYVPLIKTFPWLTYLTPYRGSRTPSLSPGETPTVFDLGRYRYAAAICFEDTLPQVVRRIFTELPKGRPPDVLLNQSNDGWFHDSSEHQMHLACSIFRAVEHRIPLARAANTGVSAVVDGNGRIVASLATGTVDAMIEGVIVETIPLDPRVALYTAWGDWLPLGCLAIMIGWFPLAHLRRKRVVLA